MLDTWNVETEESCNSTECESDNYLHVPTAHTANALCTFCIVFVLCLNQK